MDAATLATTAMRILSLTQPCALAAVRAVVAGERLARLPVEPMYGKVLLARWVTV